jgi:hypothetical protein
MYIPYLAFIVNVCQPRFVLAVVPISYGGWADTAFLVITFYRTGAYGSKGTLSMRTLPGVMYWS